MTLPKLDIPIYETKLISNGQIVKFRPFLVKEQKLFLMASQSEDVKDMISAIKQVINNCVIGEINVDSLPTFDLEYLFLQLRSRSIGEVSNLKYTCNNKIIDEKGEEKDCKNVVEFNLNLLDIQPTKNELHTNKIQISEDVGLVMKYPTFNMVDKLNLETDNINEILEIIVSCIDYIYDKESIYYTKDVSKDELVEFVESMKQTDLEKVQRFFETLPKLTKDLDFNCNKCGYQEKIKIEGIQNFFG